MLNATEYKERTARAAGMQEERYLIREGASPRSLLSGESVAGEKSGHLLTLTLSLRCSLNLSGLKLGKKNRTRLRFAAENTES